MNIVKKNWVISVLLLLFFLYGGCGYRFDPGGENIDKSIQKVYVDNFSNLTSEANVENFLRNAFIEEIIQGHRFYIVNSKENSDAFLTGSVKQLVTPPLSYATNDFSKENNVSMTIEVIFRKKQSNEIIWTSNSLFKEQAYAIKPDPFRTDKNKKKAIQKLSDDLAEKAYRNLVSGF